MKKAVCVLMICGIIFAPMAKAQAQLLDAKTQGKLSLLILLAGIAVLTRMLINSDKKKIEKLHSRLGPPDRIVEFQKGFDNWRIEWYGEKGYPFRNGVLQNETIRDCSVVHPENRGSVL